MPKKREDSAISSQAPILFAVGSYKIERPESYEGSFLADSSGHSILQSLAVGKIGEGSETIMGESLWDYGIVHSGWKQQV